MNNIIGQREAVVVSPGIQPENEELKEAMS